GLVLLDFAVRNGELQVGGDGKADGGIAAVRREGRAFLLGQRRRGEERFEAVAARIALQDIEETSLHGNGRFHDARKAFAPRHVGARRVPEGAPWLGIVVRERLFEPVDAGFLQRGAESQRAGQIVGAVGVDHDLYVRTGGAADGADDLRVLPGAVADLD